MSEPANTTVFSRAGWYAFYARDVRIASPFCCILSYLRSFTAFQGSFHLSSHTPSAMAVCWV
jgi:hypothetical protein